MSRVLVRAAKLCNSAARLRCLYNRQNPFVFTSSHRSSVNRGLCTPTDGPLYEYEPPYLVHLKPPLPIYNLMNLQVRGYDFAILERFAKFVHHVALELGLDVADTWVTPKQSLRVSVLKPNTNIAQDHHNVSLYERNVQIANLPATSVSLLIDVIEASLPAGVKLSLHSHELDHEEIRYIPDLELKELHQELEEIKKK